MTDVPQEVEHYLADIPGERGEALRAVFDATAAAMPPGYELGIHWKMPTWVLPLDTYPDTYNKQPLAYVALAAQKNYNSLYLLGVHGDSAEDAEFRREWAATGLKLNMGKSCLRFRTVADIDLGIISRTVASTPVDRFIALYERDRN